MSETPHEEMRKLCEKLFALKLPAHVVSDGALVALSPHDRSTFHIQRSGEAFIVRRMLAGQEKYLSAVSSDKSSGRHAWPPTKEWLHSLSKAIPMPVNQAWGVRRYGHISELVLFRLDRSDRPSYLYCTVGIYDHQLKPLFYEYRYPIDIKKFWEYVRRGYLHDLHQELYHAKCYTTGTKELCVVVDNDLLAPHDAWRYYGKISLGELHGETSLRSSMGW